MKYHALDKNFNGNEVVLKGWDAFLAAVFQLVTTPYGWLPEAPTAGFDMVELMGYELHSETYKDRRAELANKIRELDPMAAIEVNITRDEDPRYIDIDVTYTDLDGKNYNEEIRTEISPDGQVLTYFKDIDIK